jgi:hypothetical protein
MANGSLIVESSEPGSLVRYLDARSRTPYARRSVARVCPCYEPPDAMLEHRIRQRAYEVYQARLDNPALYDGLQAQHEILEQMRHFDRSQSKSETGSEKNGMLSRKFKRLPDGSPNHKEIVGKCPINAVVSMGRRYTRHP